MIYRVINEKYSILSIGPELVPEKYRGHILVFYSNYSGPPMRR